MIKLCFLLVLFVALHSLLADFRVKDWFKIKLGSAFRFYRIAYNLLFLFLLVNIICSLRLVQQNDYLFQPTTAIHIMAIAIVVIGVVLMIISFSSFDISEFFGFSYLSNTHQVYEKLRIKGPYKYVRHPLYFATFVLFAGLFLLQPSLLNMGIVIFLYAYTYLGALLEEKKLEKIFGQDYTDYKKKVKMIIPFII